MSGSMRIYELRCQLRSLSPLHPVRFVAALCLVMAMMGAHSALASAEEVASSGYDKAGVLHHEQCIKTASGGAVTMRDAEGHPLQNSGGVVTSAPEEREICATKKKVGISLDGLEAVSAGGVESFYSWPGQAAVSTQSEGFVAASELASKPKLTPKDEAGNGAAAPEAPGSPAYRVTPAAINGAQAYESGETWYSYSPYGQPTGGAKYALMTWSWVNVSGGGIARATVAENALFYPSDVKPIQMETHDGAGGPIDGSITVRYGYVNTGSGSLYGWMVTSDTNEGRCINHMEYVGGGAPLPDTLCEGLQAPTAIYEPSSGRNIFYADGNGAISQLWVNGSAWESVELQKVSGSGTNELTAPNTSPASVYEPSGSGRNVFYVDSNDRIWQWWVNGSHWEDVELAKASIAGPNEPVAANTSPTVIYEPNGSGRNVFYVGANGRIWQWVVHGAGWENVELHYASLGGSNEAAAANSSPVAVYEPNGSGRNVFYVGANGRIWQWWVNGSAWENVELAKASIAGPNEAAETDTSPGVVYDAGGSGRNVFYVGANGRIWQWVVHGAGWENVELEKASNGAPNEAVAWGTSPTAVYDAGGSGRNVFYVGSNRHIWQWVVNNGAWENDEIAKASKGGANEAAESGTSPTAVYEPNGTGRNVLYFGTNGGVWQWWVNGSAWENVALP